MTSGDKIQLTTGPNSEDETQAFNWWRLEAVGGVIMFELIANQMQGVVQRCQSSEVQ